jgi:hypothetical protein
MESDLKTKNQAAQVEIETSIVRFMPKPILNIATHLSSDGCNLNY